MRRILVLAVCLILSGCPLTYFATVRNETGGPIEIAWELPALASIAIGADSVVETPWYSICLTVKETSASRFFQMPERLPRGVQTSGRLSAEIRFHIVFKDEGLYLETRKGELIPIDSVDTCDTD